MKETMKQHLHFRDAYITKEKLIFSAVEMNGLFCRERNRDTAEYITQFTGEDQLQTNLHSQVIEYANKLYFIPLNGTGISICDLRNIEKTETIPYESGRHIQIIRAFLINTNIWLLPLNSGTPFLIFHTKDNTYERMFWVENEISKVIKKDEIWVDIFSAVVENEVLYLAFPNTDILFEFDLKKFNVEIKRLGDGIRLKSVTYFDKKLYMSSADRTDITVYNLDTKKIQRLDTNMTISQDIEENLIISNCGKLYVIFPNMIKLFNNEQEYFGEIDICEKFSRKTNNYRLFAGRRSEENSLWIFTACGGGNLWIKENEIHLLETFANSSTEKKMLYLQTKRIKKASEGNGYIIEGQYEETGLGLIIRPFLCEGICLRHNCSEWIGNSIWINSKMN